MSFLRYETPLPNRMDQQNTIQLLTVPIDEVPEYLLHQHREAADCHITRLKPGPSSLAHADTISITHRLKPDHPITLTRTQARQSIHGPIVGIIPDDITVSREQHMAIILAIKTWLSSPNWSWPQPAPRTDEHAHTNEQILHWMFDTESCPPARGIAYATFTGQIPPPELAAPINSTDDLYECVHLRLRIPDTLQGLKLLALHDHRWDFLADYWRQLEDQLALETHQHPPILDRILNENTLRTP